MRTQKSRSISIREFQPIFADKIVDGVHITRQDIEELKNYIDEQNSKKSDSQDAVHAFLKPIRNGVQANNYVGVLQTNSGLTIEILPKIYGKNGEGDNRAVVQQLFLKMLRTVRNINGKTFKMTNLNAKRSNLLEVFISMFLTESDLIIKRGVKSSYVSVQSNEKFLKGKMLITQQIRKNSINQSYFYNEFDEFKADSAENQLIKTTLELLLRKSKDNNNLRIILEQLEYFEFVSATTAPDQTFQKVQLGRNHKYYTQVLDWCMIFLSRKSFTSFCGPSLAFAVLFPMEEVFESYIALLVKQFLQHADVSTQERSHSLFDNTAETKQEYRLRPDIVIRYKNTSVTIADTKWKFLDGNGPSQADLYQMYAYYTRYHHKEEEVDRVILIYPYSGSYTEREFRSLTPIPEESGAKIQVKYVDLLSNDMQTQILNILK